jgi:hypothetical protein
LSRDVREAADLNMLARTTAGLIGYVGLQSLGLERLARNLERIRSDAVGVARDFIRVVSDVGRAVCDMNRNPAND